MPVRLLTNAERERANRFPSIIVTRAIHTKGVNVGLTLASAVGVHRSG